MGLREFAYGYLTDTAREAGRSEIEPAVADWIETEGKHLADHLARAVEGYMQQVVDPIPDEED